MKQPKEINYLPNLNFSTYMNRLSRMFPDYSATIQFNDEELSKLIQHMNSRSVDFEGETKGGRGDLYRQSQTNPTVRLTGILQLIKIITKNKDIQDLPDSFKILDILGGDGTIVRALATILKEPRKSERPIVFTSDIAGDMIASALQYGLPAIRQPADDLLLKDNAFDGVIIAYGTHHIPQEERLGACREAHRVIKPNGTLVIHDFEEESIQANWFNNVVDKYSLTGHKYKHLTTQEIIKYLKKNGFRNIKIIHMYDPFIASDATREGAYSKLMAYVINMYGLERLKEKGKITQKSHKKVHELIKEHINYDYSSIKGVQPNWKKAISFYENEDTFFAEMPRLAIIGIGTK